MMPWPSPSRAFPYDPPTIPDDPPTVFQARRCHAMELDWSDTPIDPDVVLARSEDELGLAWGAEVKPAAPEAPTIWNTPLALVLRQRPMIGRAMVAALVVFFGMPIVVLLAIWGAALHQP